MHKNKAENIEKGDKVRCYGSKKSGDYGEGIVLDDNYIMQGRRHYRIRIFNALENGQQREVPEGGQEFWYVLANGYWTIWGRTHQVHKIALAQSKI